MVFIIVQRSNHSFFLCRIYNWGNRMIKRLMLTISLFLSFGSIGHCDVRNLLEPYKLVYEVISTSGTHVTGQTISLLIEKSSNQYFYDFSSSTFRASGWSQKTVNLTEDSTNGIYYYNFTPPSTETSPEQYIFIVNNTNATYADHQALIVNYDDIATNVNVLKSRGR